MVRLSGGGGGRRDRRPPTSKLVTVLGNFSAIGDEIESRHADDIVPLQLGEEVAWIHPSSTCGFQVPCATLEHLLRVALPAARRSLRVARDPSLAAITLRLPAQVVMVLLVWAIAVSLCWCSRGPTRVIHERSVTCCQPRLPSALPEPGPR